ncbi:ribonuclease J [Parvibaculum sp.]|jgi:ribonuclease J|uniref:ribonuclease J n=1 Tax=Parvibaculum sp. TaxID=2024848 RepID=UPI0025E639C2|nr:ribonuclease J [Parvibaculum sp.]|tara:strand:- start:26379 stop:28088 length:1710 start_codon:yes stop_codon:yes gene_type:complete
MSISESPSAAAPRAVTPHDELVFLPLGGSGEIGMNLNLYGYGPEDDRCWIIVDLGVTFGDERTPGIDLIMPDPAFIEERRDELLGIVLTHAHEDHIGAVAHIWPRLRCPVYATPFTAALVRGKLIEAGLEDEVPMHIIPMGHRFDLGPFDIELVTLTHSILEPNALAIRTPLGLVLHTGDWKIDPDPVVGGDIDEARLRAIGDEGVRAIVCDSTNVFSPGTSGSEADVAASLTELLKSCEGRVAVTTFASNVARLESIIRAGDACGRHPVLVGRAMHRVVSAAREAGYLTDLPRIVSENDAGFLPRDKVLFVCTGSQGEPRAALSRIAEDNHPQIVLDKGDTVVFSSRVIPGNETSIFDLQNLLAERGIRVITEKDHFVHVSGHPCRDELAAMYQWIRPEVSIPVHGEARHLAEHAAFARELQVPEQVVVKNGLMVRIAPGIAEVVDEAPSGRIYLDGEVLTDSDEGAVAERRRLSFAGSVFVSVVLDGKGEVLGDPQVRLMGLPEEDSHGIPFEDRALDAVDDALDRLPMKRRKNDDDVAEFLRRAVRGALRREWGKKAQVAVVVTRI